MPQELFANPPSAGGVSPWFFSTLTNSVLTTPVAGTVETWIISQAPPSSLTVAGGQFHFIIDQEICIDLTGGGGTSRQVQRGADGTVPQTHTGTTSLYYLVTAGVLQRFGQIDTAVLPDLVGGTSGVIWRGGQLRVVYEALNAHDINPGTGAQWLLPGSASDQGTGMQAFLNAVGGATTGSGAGVVPPGFYKMGSTALNWPNNNCSIEGALGAASSPGRAITTLNWETDTTNAPETTAMINNLGSFAVAGSSQRIARMSLLGPDLHTGFGCRPAASAAINLRGSGTAEHLYIEGFGAAFLPGNANGSANVHADHFNVSDITVSNCAWGFYQLPAISGGDLHIRRVKMTCNLAPFGLAASNGGYAGALISESGLYGPFTFFRVDDGQRGGGNIMDGVIFAGVSCENPGHGFIYDEQWSTGINGAAVFNNDFSGCFMQNPSGVSGAFWPWTGTFNITNITGSVVTVTNNIGYVFRPGWVATGTGFAGQTITSISGTWPATSFALTLSGPPTGSPTTVTISAPTIATIACGAFHHNILGNNPSSEAPIVAPFVRAQVGCHSNRADFGDNFAGYISAGQPIVAPDSGSVFSSTQVAANQWGAYSPAAVAYTSIEATGAIAVNDVVEMNTNLATGNVRAIAATGLGSKTLGVALQAVVSGTPSLDVQIGTGRTNPDVVAVNNKGTATILAGARVKPDPAHVGGVKTVDLPTDASIGQAQAAIAGGASGNVWLDVGAVGQNSGPSDLSLITTVPTTQQAGTAYTLALADLGTCVEFTANAAIVVTVPTGVFAATQIIEGCLVGTGPLTIVFPGGTIRSDGGRVAAGGQYASWSWRFRSATEVLLSGDLA